MKIPTPISQEASGTHGYYHIDLYEENSISVNEFEEMANKLEKSVLTEKERIIPTDKESKSKYYDYLQEKFWKTLTFSKPIYGADVKLFILLIILDDRYSFFTKYTMEC
jgi:hypothetical protein